jgi:hypothetical protein
VIGLLVAVIATAVVFMVWFFRQNAYLFVPRSLQPAARAIGLMKPEVITKPLGMNLAPPVGSTEARVKVTVIMEHCLLPVQDLLVSLGRAFPSHLRIEFLNLYAAEGRKLLNEHQVSCAGVFVNGECRFRIAEGGMEKEFLLQGMPGSNYNLAHVAAAVKQELVAAYGTLPEGFDASPVLKDLPSAVSPASPHSE